MPMLLTRRSLLAAALSALTWSRRSFSMRDSPGGAPAPLRAGDNFYQFVNSAWLQTAVIPADVPIWGATSYLVATTAERVHQILEVAAREPLSTEQQQLGNLYAALMDETSIEHLGIDPIRPHLDRIYAIETIEALALMLADLARSLPRDWQERTAPSTPVPITPTVMIDIVDPTRYVPTLLQGGLGMPDRSFYLSEGPYWEGIRSTYRHYLETLFRMTGKTEPENRAENAYHLEQVLATAQRPRTELSDFGKRHDIWTRADFERRAPGLYWQSFFEAVGYGDANRIGVADPAAIVAASALCQQVPIAQWHDYLAARTLTSFAPLGAKAWADADFDYRERTLKGAAQAQPRWRRMAAHIDLAMGPEIGAQYIRKHFSPAVRETLNSMTTYIKAAMAERIARLTWMSASTKEQALAKLAEARIEVGGPSEPVSYAGLRVDRQNAWQNLERAAQFDYRRRLARLDSAVNRRDWDLLPHQPNGQANQPLVKLMITAALIQPPFYFEGADSAVNYGGVGFTIAHELSHLFDDLGAQYDSRGRLRNWWQDADRDRFSKAGEALVDQYNEYEVLPGLKANGRQTLSENIADLAGVALALDAYHRSLGRKPAPIIAGLTGERRFFMAFASCWRAKLREEYQRRMTAVDTHSLPEFRVLTVRNIDGWYTAFDVKPTEAMYLPPEKRVRIW